MPKCPCACHLLDNPSHKQRIMCMSCECDWKNRESYKANSLDKFIP